jgi:hypothetical protein
MPMHKRDFEDVAQAIYAERSKLNPLESPEHAQAFNALRGVAAVLAATWEGRWAQFDPEKFVSVCMTGRYPR